MNFRNRTALYSSCLLILLGVGGGCVAPYLAPGAPVPAPPTTFWNKMGIPQAGAGIRDSLLNRRGNFPGLEAKPPTLRLADPRNLAEGQPEMLKSAAKIKMAEDMKKQKLKALKYLADMNCGCYNKDGKVEAAFLEALDDCDPDVRLAAVEGLSKAAACSTDSGCRFCKGKKDNKERKLCQHGLLKCGMCKQDGPDCCDSCRTTCCTRKLQDKLQDVAYGMTDDGCYKEPVLEIRTAAEALLCLCPCAPIEPEELIRPAPFGPEELVRPDALKKPGPLNIQEGSQPAGGGEGSGSDGAGTNQSMRLTDTGLQHYVSSSGTPASMSLSDSGASGMEVPEILAGRREMPKACQAVAAGTISNPDLLVSCEAVKFNQLLGELVVEMPYASKLQSGWRVLVLDSSDCQCFGTISDVGGRRVLITLDQSTGFVPSADSAVRFGVIAQ